MDIIELKQESNNIIFNVNSTLAVIYMPDAYYVL